MVDDVILLSLLYSKQEMIAGRTLLQKTIYFLNEKNDLGIDFVPYYYGPYSTEVTDALESLKSSGIIREEVREYVSFDFHVTFEPRKYIYHLTETGRKMAENIAKENFPLAQRIERTVSSMQNQGALNSYKALSIAAKMHNILKLEDKSMTVGEILEEAKVLGWVISEDEAKNAIQFLNGFNLVSSS